MGRRRRHQAEAYGRKARREELGCNYQCYNTWRDAWDPSIDRANGRTSRWVEDEDIKLKVAVQTHGEKEWVEISALVPGRTRHQCYNRCCDVLDPSIDRANGRTGTNGSITGA
jgi:hypothetical protein